MRRHATSEVAAVKSLKGLLVRLSKLRYTMHITSIGVGIFVSESDVQNALKEIIKM